ATVASRSISSPCSAQRTCVVVASWRMPNRLASTNASAVSAACRRFACTLRGALRRRAGVESAEARRGHLGNSTETARDTRFSRGLTRLRHDALVFSRCPELVLTREAHAHQLLRVTWEHKRWNELTRDELYAVLALRQRIFVVEHRRPCLDADGA